MNLRVCRISSYKMKEAMDKTSASRHVEATEEFAYKTLQDYEVISVIGSGSFGTCFKVRDKRTGALFAWKGMDYDELSDSQKESLVSEINVLRQLQHPNIVQYYHHLVNHAAKSVFIVMECCEGGDLAQLITRARVHRKRFEEQYIWRVLLQVCRALQVCHNKIQQGTILHRDIKPANIFLDAQGNAKLGDFGLARMLRRNESFAQTFVGTPYYMSPELVKGSRYDRKSDIWAVGCLAYEMCALRPPFKGHEFEQLSANISTGKFSSIPEVYSSDLQQIIAFMLAVENDQRPSVEVITRHPLLVRNIVEIDSEFPKLVPAAEDADGTGSGDIRCKLQYSTATDLSSTMLTEQHSFNETYGQRHLSVSGVFTPDLRAELFYSTKRRIFEKPTLQQSDPELYDSIRREEYTTVNDTIKLQSSAISIPTTAELLGTSETRTENQIKSPTLVTQSTFDRILQQRLHAIRAHECLLKQREVNLDLRERQLNEKEKRLQELQQNLHERTKFITEKEHSVTKLVANNPPEVVQCPNHLERPVVPLRKEEVTSTAAANSKPPPIPPRKPAHDDSYCSIEPNDSFLQPPTVAKLNLAALTFPTLRKVTFQSPKKFITYDIENMPPRATSKSSLKTSRSAGKDTHHNNSQMRASCTSKGSDESSESTTQRRKSILSIFGLHRSNKDAAKVAATTATVSATNDCLPSHKKETQVISKCATTDLANMWTREHKRAAFDLLAAMNASERYGQSDKPSLTTHHKFRQSVQQRITLSRSRLRHTLTVAPTKARKPALI